MTRPLPSSLCPADGDSGVYLAASPEARVILDSLS